jgi:hypothetical protein
LVESVLIFLILVTRSKLFPDLVRVRKLQEKSKIFFFSYFWGTKRTFRVEEELQWGNGWKIEFHLIETLERNYI